GAPSATEAAFTPLQVRTPAISYRRITRWERPSSFGHAYARIHHSGVVVLRIVIRRPVKSPGTGQQHHREEQHQQRSLHKMLRFYWPTSFYMMLFIQDKNIVCFRDFAS